MVQEVCSVLDEYNNDHKYADYWFIHKLCIILVDQKDLHNYLTDIVVEDEGKKISYFNLLNRVMHINLNGDYDKKAKDYYGAEYYRWFNLEVLSTLLHEMAHVRQEKIRKESPYSIEGTLIDMNDFFSIIRNHRSFLDRIKIREFINYYNHYHDMSPVERMANIEAYKEVSKVLDSSPSTGIIKRYKEYASDRAYRQISKGYKLVGRYTNSPSLDFLSGMKNTGNKDFIQHSHIFDIKNLSYNDRLYYGFSLDRNEYRGISKVLSR